MERTEAAMILAGVTPEDRKEVSAPTNLHVITGTIVGNSSEGKALLQLDGIVLSEDGNQYIEVDTLGGLEEGDVATVLLTGEPGRGMTPLAIGAAGSIDRIYADAMKVHELTTEILRATTAYITDLQAESITVQNLKAANAYIDNLVANRITASIITADHATITNLDANYAKINAANIDTAVIRDAWVDKLMVQSGLIAHQGTVFTLDAIKVNASNITAGTIDVDRLIVSDQNGQKYLVHVGSGGTPTYEKLDGNVIADNTITADKLVAESVTASKITTENIVGSGGWINLRNGTFSYVNALTGQGMSWNGVSLDISGNIVVGPANGPHIVMESGQGYARLVIYQDATERAGVVNIDSMTIDASSSSTGQDETKYGIQVSDGTNDDSYVSIRPAIDTDSNGKLYFKDASELTVNGMDSELHTSSVAVSNGEAKLYGTSDYIYLGDNSAGAVFRFQKSTGSFQRYDGTTWEALVYLATVSRTKNTVLAAPSSGNGKAAFRKLVNSDMPTIAWAYLTGSATSSNYLRYKCVSGWVTVEINYGSSAALSSGVSKTFGTLPASYAPSKTVTTTADLESNNVAAMWVDTSGRVYIKAFTTSSVIYGSIVYPIV